MKLRFISVLAGVFALAAVSANAQGPMGGPPMGGGMMGGGMMGGMMGGFGGFGTVDMSEFAKIQTDRLAGALELTGKQYEQIYNIYLKELDRRVNNLEDENSGGFGGFGGFDMSMMGGPGMGPGAPGMGGGFPGMGRPEGAEGGMAGMNLTQAQRTYLRIMAQEPTKKDIKAQQKIEKKMAKILTPEKFAQWKEIEKQPLPMIFMNNPQINPGAAGDPIMRGGPAMGGDPIMRGGPGMGGDPIMRGGPGMGGPGGPGAPGSAPGSGPGAPGSGPGSPGSGPGAPAM